MLVEDVLVCRMIEPCGAVRRRRRRRRRASDGKDLAVRPAHDNLQFSLHGKVCEEL